MARYSEGFKQRTVARLLPPESSPVEVVSREIGISSGTLERWRSEALTAPSNDKTWTAAARLETAMDDDAKMHDAGSKGSPNKLEKWRSSAVQALATPEETRREEPQTGEEITIEPRQLLTVKASSVLRQAINNGPRGVYRPTLVSPF